MNLGLFDEPAPPRPAARQSTEAERAAYWSGFAVGLYQHAGVAPRDEGEARYWQDGQRLGALARPRSKANG